MGSAMLLRVARPIAVSLPLRWAVGIGIVLGASLSLRARAAQADYIMLRNGGEIRGELLSESSRAGAKSKSRPDRGEIVSIRMLSGALVAVGQGDVAAVVRRRMVVEEYETLRRAAPDTLEAQWDLAEWCRQKSLGKERETHLRAVVALDPENAAEH